MSFLVTRPAWPEPLKREMSTLCSAAIFRTSGVDLRRSRSSPVSVPASPSPWDRAVAGADGADAETGSRVDGAGGAGTGRGVDLGASAALGAAGAAGAFADSAADFSVSM